MESAYYIGIMSGTSLDGVDVVLADLGLHQHTLIKTFFLPYDHALKTKLLTLHYPGNDELNQAALLANQLANLYAQAIAGLLENDPYLLQSVLAIGCHGQTVRHCPQNGKGYTIQLVNAALLAELTQTTVVADFRSRDIAAGGQGAPLVPAFHQALFMDSKHRRVIVNIGGIANITYLDPEVPVTGFDCGPGNLLMDAWCSDHLGHPYDKNGRWAATGKVLPDLLEKFYADDFFINPPPKSTGRDLFNSGWLENHLQGSESSEDVQRTLLQLTALSIVSAINQYYPSTDEVFLCGGGAHNTLLVSDLEKHLPDKKVALTDELGVPVDWVEAYAFAWLAQQTICGQTGNIPSVTGAKGKRILGAIYSA
ncbi:MAG: anhydro-N-acetylmuramic acid kinase [Nitrosomonas sp.]|nr:anhydro-N-acetylmuramic acid kinase [Nitrosomonas sp.]MCW5608162.1 anhydro-N-acetylmuramic acid kinase [Nitrosomonas sp.]